MLGCSLSAFALFLTETSIFIYQVVFLFVHGVVSREGLMFVKMFWPSSGLHINFFRNNGHFCRQLLLKELSS